MTRRPHPEPSKKSGMYTRTGNSHLQQYDEKSVKSRQRLNMNRGNEGRYDHNHGMTGVPESIGYNGSNHDHHHQHVYVNDSDEVSTLHSKRSKGSRQRQFRGVTADGSSAQPTLMSRNNAAANENYHREQEPFNQVPNDNRASHGNVERRSGEFSDSMSRGSKPAFVGAYVEAKGGPNYYRGMSDLEDDYGMGSVGGIQSKAGSAYPVSDERIALSVAIQHHSHKLLETDIDINEVWDLDDPLGDFGAAVLSARRKNSSIIDIEPSSTSQSFRERAISLVSCFNSIEEHRRYFLPTESKQIRIFLFFLAVALSSLTAFYFSNGSFGVYAATFFSAEPLDTVDVDVTVIPKEDGRPKAPFVPTGMGPGEGLERKRIALPPIIVQNLGDTNQRVTQRHTPLFWLIPKSGGNAVKKVMSQCFNMIEASDMGIGYDHEPRLKVYVSQESREKFVNVDLNSIAGIERAKKLGLVESGLADVIISPNLFQTVGLFSPQYPGKAYALFRHPMETALSMYRSNEISSQINIEEFYEDGSLVDNNWMTRQLINKPDGILDDDDVDQAMEMLRRKFIVGLVDDMRESVKRYMRYFGWTSNEMSQSQVNVCITQVTQLKTSIDKINEGSRLWDLVLKHNQYDLILFQYAERLYIDQSDSLPSPAM